MELVVGYPVTDYMYERNITGTVSDARYVKVRDVFSLLNEWAPRINAKLKRKIFWTKDYRFQFNDFNMNKVNLFHFFNTISYGRTPWITTFETIIPRFLRESFEKEYSQKVRNALKQISGSACKRIIAMSQCAANKQ